MMEFLKEVERQFGGLWDRAIEFVTVMIPNGFQEVLNTAMVYPMLSGCVVLFVVVVLALWFRNGKKK